MPYKGSTETSKKNGYLGQIQKTKKKIKSSTRKKSWITKTFCYNKRKNKFRNLMESWKKKRKPDTRFLIWQILVQKLNQKFQKLNKERKSVFNISSCLEKKRKLNPTSINCQKKQNSLEEKRLWKHAWQYMGVQS